MQGEADRVRAINQRFYDAVSHQNMLAMEQVWSHTRYVRCVHPGWNMLEGWDMIRESWREIFTDAICLTVEAEDPDVTVLGPTAIVTCREKITTFTLDGSSTSMAQATNIFEKVDGRWLLIHHHASPLALPEPEGPGESD